MCSKDYSSKHLSIKVLTKGAYYSSYYSPLVKYNGTYFDFGVLY